MQTSNTERRQKLEELLADEDRQRVAQNEVGRGWGNGGWPLGPPANAPRSRHPRCPNPRSNASLNQPHLHQWGEPPSNALNPLRRGPQTIKTP
jgi:hypothetical protein